MILKSLHPWNLSIAEARRVQERLAKQVKQTPLRKKIRIIAGTDVSYNKESGLFVAGVVVMNWPGLEVIEEVTSTGRTPFPYVPGYLSFREIPSLAKALAQVKSKVDLLVCDGQGIAHPRRLGLASHLGLLTGLPAIGAAKSRLTGIHREPGRRRGSSADLLDEKTGEIIGCVLRTRDGVKPLYVSVGHKVSLKDARHWVLSLACKTRLPEPTKLADHLVGKAMRSLRIEPSH